MRRKKNLLIYSLVLGGVVLPSLASCGPEEGQQSESTQFVIEVGEYDENAGKVSLTNTSGDINIISEVDVTIIAFEGYKVTSIKFNGTALDTNTLSFKVRPTKGTNTLDVVFEEDTLEETPVENFTIKIESTNGGTISADKLSGVPGETVNLVVTPNDGYELISLIINGTAVDPNTRSFVAIKGENVVRGAFSELPKTYNIVVEETENGVLTVDKNSGTVGETVNFSIEADEGYELSKIVINGKTVDNSVRSFIPVEGNNYLRAEFKLIETEPEPEPEPEPTEDTFDISATSTNGGSVSVDKTSGKVGESVNITLKADQGYEIYSLSINNEFVPVDTTTFTPKKGSNTIHASFKEIEVSDSYFTIDVINNEGGEVNLDKYEGDQGDTVNVSIVPEVGYEVVGITVNGVPRRLDQLEFTFRPVKEGTSTLEVTFAKVEIDLDQGLTFEGFEYPNHSDFASEEDFLDYICSFISEFYPNMNEEVTKENFRALDLYNSFVVRYGFTKQVLDVRLRQNMNEEIVALFNKTSLSDITLDECKTISSFLVSCAHDLDLPQFAGVASFLSCGMIVGYSSNGDLTNVYNYNRMGFLDGAKEQFKNNQTIVSYIDELQSGSNVDIKDNIADFQKVTDVFSEIIYRAAKELVNLEGGLYTADAVASLMYNALGIFTDLTIEGDNFVATDKMFKDLLSFVKDVLNLTSFSKESFYKICDTLSKAKDPISTISQILPATEGSFYYSSLKEVFDLLNENKDTAYYLLRLLKETSLLVEPNIVDTIISLVSSPDFENDKKSAMIFVLIAQKFGAALEKMDVSLPGTIDLIKNSGVFLTEFREIITSGVRSGVTSENAFDMEYVVNLILEASNKDYNALTNEEITMYNEALNNLKTFFTPIEKEEESYSVSFDRYYKKNEALNLKVLDEEGNDVTSLVNVEDFDTSSIGYKRVCLTFPNSTVSYFSYYVNYSGKVMDDVTLTFELNEEVNANVELTYRSDEHPEGVKENFLSGVNAGFKTSEKGEFYTYRQDDSGDYFFVKYRVI